MLKGDYQSMNSLAKPITAQRPPRLSPAPTTRRIALALLKGLGALAILLTPLPVALLPFATSVPAPVWILLSAIDIGLVAALFWFRWALPAVLSAAAGMLLVALVAVLASQAYATTPPILGSDGQPLPGSIAELERVELNGSRQWITIRGQDVRNPVLLFLAGGPGGSQLATVRHSLGGLEEHFIVVNWDQPGAGKSFHAVPSSELTPERYISDAQALIHYLRQRFGVEKVYVLGESWGSVLGIWLAQRHPDLVHAFIGTGQMVAFEENDRWCYEFALGLAEERGDTKKVAQLEKQGPPPYYGEGVAMKQAAYLLDTFAYMNQDPRIAGGFNTIQDLFSSEYGLYDKVNWVRGPLDTLGTVYPMLWDVDLRDQASSLQVPVYFLIGRHDVNAPPALAESYFALLEAPHKELVWFDRSGHNPWTSEPDRFVQEVVRRVLDVGGTLVAD
jgi:pimeloyl-ACP methyl ester carboxylesterase